MRDKISTCDGTKIWILQVIKFILVGIMLWIIPCFVQGQSLDSIPNSTYNNRFHWDVFCYSIPNQGIEPIKHPGLTANGFDNGGDNSHGYGLKQILERTLMFAALSVRSLLPTRQTN